jgi:hypothetical protein
MVVSGYYDDEGAGESGWCVLPAVVLFRYYVGLAIITDLGEWYGLTQ